MQRNSNTRTLTFELSSLFKGTKRDKKNMKIPVTIRTLFNTTEVIKNVLSFIKNTRICTREWILGTVEDEEVYGGGWGVLE